MTGYKTDDVARDIASERVRAANTLLTNAETKLRQMAHRYHAASAGAAKMKQAEALYAAAREFVAAELLLANAQDGTNE